MADSPPAMLREQCVEATLVLKSLLAPKEAEYDGSEPVAAPPPPPPAVDGAAKVLVFLVSAKNHLETVALSDRPHLPSLSWLRRAIREKPSKSLGSSDWVLSVLETTIQALRLPGRTSTHISLREAALGTIGLLYQDLR
jgi:hypothetical protein